MLTVIVALVLAGATFAYVVYPLLRQKPGEKQLAGNRRLEGLSVRERAARSAIEDLQYDFESGQLPEEDYRALRQEYEERASAIARELDQTGKGKPQEEEADLEKEILRLRRPQKKDTPVAEGAVCPKCGSKSRAGDKVCPRCGVRLPLLCPQCGASYRRGDRFCARCAASLPTTRPSR